MGQAPVHWCRPAHRLAVVITAALFTTLAFAGGSAENVLLLVDPARADALQVANHYVAVRNLPVQNILYLDPTAPGFGDIAAYQHEALRGKLVADGLRDHVDYIILAPPADFYVDAQGLVHGSCAISRFSLTTAYYLALMADEILAGGINFSFRNRYWSPGEDPYNFDSEVLWQDGGPSADGRGRYLYLSAMLGYTGERGNTVGELLSMIDRCAAADGTHPAGTIYFMKTSDAFRSSLRDWAYPNAVTTVAALGGTAELLYDVLPSGRHDALGVMTGWADPDIDGADMTLLPGSIGDHATSAAAWFDIPDQTKLSRWIAKGAAGSFGTVDEPCALRGKFPQANEYFSICKGRTWPNRSSAASNTRRFRACSTAIP